MMEWAKIARGEESDDHPFLDRTVLQLQQRENDEDKWKYSDFFLLPLLIGQHDSLEEREKETIELMLKFSKARLQTLKNKANTSDLESEVSRFDAVCAHIWKCLSMARGLKSEQETVLIISVDFCNRINPPLPKRYFGSSVLPLPICSSVGELLSKPLSYVARKIRTAIQGFSDEKARSFLKCIHNMPDISGIRHFRKVGYPHGAFNGNPNLFITSWYGLPFYDANLWGDEVCYMGPGSLGSDGRFILIQGPDEDGSFLVPMRVQTEHAAAFQKYFNEEI